MGIPIRQFTAARLAGLVALAAGLAAFGGWYYLFVTSQTAYFQQRNLRIVTTVGTQFDAAAKAEAKVFQILAQDKNGKATLETMWKAPRYQGPAPPLEHVNKANARVVLVTEEDEPKFQISIGDGTAKPPVAVTFPIERVGDAAVRGRLGPQTFDTMLLMSREGRVILGDGLRVKSLGASGLGAVPLRNADGKEVAFGTIAAVPGVYRATIASIDYLVFVAPCCPSIAGGLLVAGLVDAGTFSSESRAISTTIVKIAGVVLLLAIVSWPFFRLVLIGERQRLRRSDFFQLGLSSIAGLGIVTILILDSTAYWRLGRDRDLQLSVLADELESRAAQEISAGFNQLSCLEKSLAATPIDYEKEPLRFADVTRGAKSGTWACGGSETAPWLYPQFESVSLIDDSGMQNRKLAALPWVPSLISVVDRAYFQATSRGRLWPVSPFCPEGCVVQSVWAWTTGRPQAVVAKPASADAHAVGISYKVATIALPMFSLIRPVLPSGFEYAIIADDGQVQFHSDYRRNLNENFFQETEDNRRLHAEMHAHSTEPLNLRYGGAAYRAFVKPMKGTPWSVVTLYRKGEGWALNREWIVVSFIFLTLYLVLWGAIAAVTLVHDASWVWPDPARRSVYIAVVACHVLLLALAAVFGLFLQRGDLLQLGLVLPLAGWVFTAMLLQRRPTPAASSETPLVQYSAAACLTLVVCGITPGVLLFLASFQIHAQSYVKNNELEFARRLHEHQESLRQAYPDLVGPASPLDERGRYHEFLYGMTITRSAAVPDAAASDEHQHHHDVILGALEEYLPYYSDASERWRELFHDHAGDDSWTSGRDAGGRLMLATTLDSARYVMTSGIPGLLQGDATAESAAESPRVQAMALFGSFGGVMMVGVALGLLTVTIVSRLKRHVFLTSVVQPRWARARLALNAGDNMFVRCDDGTTQQHIEGAEVLRLEPIARASNPQQIWRLKLSEIDRNQDPCVAVLVDDLDQSVEDGETMKLKLAFMEDLVEDASRSVVVLSRHSAHGLAEAMRRAGDSGTGERWRALIQSFVLIDWRARADGAPLAEIAVETPAGAPLTPAQRLLNNEMRSGDPFVAKVCRAIAQSAAGEQPLRRGEALDELADRTAHYYRQIWNCCADEDKVVLTHVAEDGLVNWSLRKGVRRLLAKRLLFKDPELRLMNESFRRFVLSQPCLTEVRALESSEQPSPWDRLRVPFGFAMVAASVFLFATQKELYNAILGTTTAAAASVPTLIKAVGTLAGSRGGDVKPGA